MCTKFSWSQDLNPSNHFECCINCNQSFLDLCPVPEIANGRILIDGTKEEGFLFGEVLCDTGYHLVGFSKTLKCREGVWSQRVMPMCGE